MESMTRIVELPEDHPLWMYRKQRDRYEDIIREQNEAFAARDHARIQAAQMRMHYLRESVAARRPRVDAPMQAYLQSWANSRHSMAALGGMVAANYGSEPSTPPRHGSGQGMTRGYWRGAIGQHPGYRLAAHT